MRNQPRMKTSARGTGRGRPRAGAFKGPVDDYDWFKKSWEASVEFETAMAGVAKTTDCRRCSRTMGEKIKLLRRKSRCAVEIRRCGAEGQLGIADKTAASLRVHGGAGVSTTYRRTSCEHLRKGELMAPPRRIRPHGSSIVRWATRRETEATSGLAQHCRS